MLLLCGQVELGHRFEMFLLQALKLCEIGIVLTCGEGHQLNQAIGHAAHCRDDHGHAFSILTERTQDASYCLVATRVGHARAAEFVNDPFGSHYVLTSRPPLSESTAYESFTEIQSGRKDWSSGNSHSHRASAPCRWAHE